MLLTECWTIFSSHKISWERGGCGHFLAFFFFHIRWILYNPPWKIFWDLLSLWMRGAGAATPGKWVVIKPVMALITQETQEIYLQRKNAKFLLICIIFVLFSHFASLQHFLNICETFELKSLPSWDIWPPTCLLTKPEKNACLRKRSFYFGFQRHCSFSALFFCIIVILIIL